MAELNFDLLVFICDGLDESLITEYFTSKHDVEMVRFCRKKHCEEYSIDYLNSLPVEEVGNEVISLMYNWRD